MRGSLLFLGIVSLLLALGLSWNLIADDQPQTRKPEKPSLENIQPKVDQSDAAEQREEKREPFVPRLDPKSPLAKFMRKKLASSNLILEGLVTENFGKISEGAKQLEELSTEEQWRVSNDAIYRQLSDDFRRIAKQLQKDAKEPTIDPAALTWIKATMSCIECHKYTKGILISGD